VKRNENTWRRRGRIVPLRWGSVCCPILLIGGYYGPGTRRNHQRRLRTHRHISLYLLWLIILQINPVTKLRFFRPLVAVQLIRNAIIHIYSLFKCYC